MFRSGFTTLIISIDKIEGIMKIVKSTEDSDLFLKDVSEKLKIKQKNKNEDFWECY